MYRTHSSSKHITNSSLSPINRSQAQEIISIYDVPIYLTPQKKNYKILSNFDEQLLPQIRRLIETPSRFEENSSISSYTPVSTSNIAYQTLNERPTRKNRLRHSNKRGKSMENLSYSKMTDAIFPKIYKNQSKIKCKKCVKFSYLFEKTLIE